MDEKYDGGVNCYGLSYACIKKGKDDYPKKHLKEHMLKVSKEGPPSNGELAMI